MSEENIQNTTDSRERVYEFAYLFSVSLDSEQLEKEFSKLKEEIEKISKEIVSESAPELIDLAYTIKINDEGKNIKHDKAYFGWIKFVTDPSYLGEFEEELKFNKNLIRYLLVKTVREDTRAQLEEDAMRKLEEVKTTATIEQKPDQEKQQQTEEEDIDKIVEDLLAKIDEDIEEDSQEQQEEQNSSDKS